MKSVFKKAALQCMMVAIGLSLSAAAMGAAMDKTVHLTAGKAKTIELGGPVSDLLVANPAIADVGTLRSNRLYVVGKAVGDTNILAFDPQGNPLADISVHVRVDQKTLADAVKEFFPDEKVEVKTINEDIVLSGYVSNPLVANRVRDLASRFLGDAQKQTIVDLMTVQGEQQVMLKVKVIEAKRSALREFGIETDYRSLSTGAPENGGVFNAIAGTGLTELAPFAAGSLFISDTDRGFGPLEFGIQGLEREGLINVLAEPNLTAISGETAGFLAGGEFPVPTGRDLEGNITIEFKQFGVSLNFTPTVLSRDRISLNLSTEVSARAEDNGVTLVNTVIPGLSVRKAETTVELGSGGTIMLAGLIKSDTLHTLTGFPGLQDLPILGNLFKSKSFARDESELVILVTPYLVEPYAKAEAVNAKASASAHLAQASAQAQAAVMQQEPVQSAAVVAEPLTPAAAAASVAPTPLTDTWINNLNRAYGSKAPKSLPTGRRFGYIVD